MEQTQAFQDALAALEKALETPLVPGELESWVQETQGAADEAARLLDRQIEVVHRDVLAEIEEQDAGLEARVEEVRQGDRTSRELLRTFQGRLGDLAARVEQIEPDEKQAEGAIVAVVEIGLKFVIHARTQETALETWLLEAFDRDTGTVD